MGLKKALDAITKPKENAKLNKAKSQYEEAKTQYGSELAEMDFYEKTYNGSRKVAGNPNKPNQKVIKEAINVRNIAYELIESQVDSSIPMPKVTPIHKEDAELATMLESMLQNEVRLLDLSELNDKQERTVPIQGGSFFHVEWDNTKGYHCNVGGLSVSERHPRCVIPQPGVTEVEDMDYIFVVYSMTKEAVKRKYGVDVEKASETERQTRVDDKINSDIVSVVKKYYKNENGGIGLLSWCDDYVLEDMDDYQSRQLEKCTKCGKVKDGDVCECGNKKFKKEKDEYEELTEDIELYNGERISAISEIQAQFKLDENGDGFLEEDGTPVIEAVEIHTKIPYYKPDCFPLVLRRNVSKNGKLLGFSDVDVIKDQQDAIKKVISKAQEKAIRGGSVLMLPKTVKTVTDGDYQVIRLNNPSEKDMIDVKNLQVDISTDLALARYNYDWAQSSLGITDSYQGKYDSSATSGTAKQFAINQAAGRLESKRVMKKAAYEKLYMMMFKFMLAYADQPVPVTKKDTNGNLVFSHFSRYDFLKQDAAGEWYWNDEFIIETDPTSTIMMNREALWQQADFKLQSQAFGPFGQTRTLLRFWTFLAANDYPNAAEMKTSFEQQLAEEEQQAQMLQRLQGGIPNEMPQM